jgi:Protein of unknown function (DUF3102)
MVRRRGPTPTRDQMLLYMGLSPEQKTKLGEVAARIRERDGKSVEAMLVTGDELRVIKTWLVHGEWLTWLRLELRYSFSTAERYMRAATWHAELAKQGKIVKLTNLSFSGIWMLSRKSTPAEIVERVLEKAMKGPVRNYDIQDVIDEAKKIKREALRIRT